MTLNTIMKGKNTSKYLFQRVLNLHGRVNHSARPIDVVFNVQGEKFYACSLMLFIRSKYFATMLSGEWAESNVNEIKDIMDEDVDENNKKNYEDENLIDEYDKKLINEKV